MNDFILRGFCQHLNCTLPVQFMLNEKKWVHRDQTFMYFDHDADGVGFLSPKQIIVLLNNKSNWREWAMSKKWKPKDGYGEQVALLLEDNPFLVASILKDAGEKNSKEENK